ncbi:TNF receptor-associated factor 4 [Oopsacas minuta]|uniref:TNF receptor-associated factor 4 n=1 Tax=Oopsacas minuta TaxID=111878 RepID=A0AAV7JXR5_9METZ|nr:TNF receptor-associated factor 4 [Oopsacas minuta]
MFPGWRRTKSASLISHPGSDRRMDSVISQLTSKPVPLILESPISRPDTPTNSPTKPANRANSISPIRNKPSSPYLSSRDKMNRKRRSQTGPPSISPTRVTGEPPSRTQSDLPHLAQALNPPQHHNPATQLQSISSSSGILSSGSIFSAYADSTSSVATSGSEQVQPTYSDLDQAIISHVAKSPQNRPTNLTIPHNRRVITSKTPSPHKPMHPDMTIKSPHKLHLFWGPQQIGSMSYDEKFTRPFTETSDGFADPSLVTVPSHVIPTSLADKQTCITPQDDCSIQLKQTPSVDSLASSTVHVITSIREEIQDLIGNSSATSMANKSDSSPDISWVQKHSSKESINVTKQSWGPVSRMLDFCYTCLEDDVVGPSSSPASPIPPQANNPDKSHHPLRRSRALSTPDERTVTFQRSNPLPSLIPENSNRDIFLLTSNIIPVPNASAPSPLIPPAHKFSLQRLHSLPSKSIHSSTAGSSSTNTFTDHSDNTPNKRASEYAETNKTPGLTIELRDRNKSSDTGRRVFRRKSSSFSSITSEVQMLEEGQNTETIFCPRITARRKRSLERLESVEIPMRENIAFKAELRKYVIMNLFDTEISYVRSLESIIKDNGERLTLQIQLHNPLLLTTLESLLSHLALLFNKHKSFLMRIEAAYKNYNQMTTIGGIIWQHFSQPVLLETYLKYIQCYQALIDTLRITTSKTPNKQKKNPNSKDPFEKLTLTDLLIQPIQRPSRYTLIIKDLQKQSIPGSSEFQQLANAMQQVGTFTMKMNAFLKKDIPCGPEVLKELEMMIDGLENLTKPNRMLLRLGGDFVTETACLADTGYKCGGCVEKGEDARPAEANRRATKMLQVNCPFYEQKCGWNGSLDDLHEHLNSECSHLPVECPYGCNQCVARSEYHLHTQYECNMRPTKCTYCNRVLASSVLNEHYTKCLEVPVSCPNCCSDAEIPQSQLIGHLDNECPLSHVSCPYGKYGCVADKMPRRDIQEHERLCVHDHLRIICRRLDKLDEAIKTNQSGGALWRVDSIKDKLLAGATFVGPQFYVGMRKFQTVIITQGKQANRISFYVRLLRGDLDESLAWPFKGKMTFTLLSKKPNERKSLKYTFLSEINNPNAFTHLAEDNACCVGFTINNALQHLSSEKLIQDNSILLRSSVERSPTYYLSPRRDKCIFLFSDLIILCSSRPKSGSLVRASSFNSESSIIDLAKRKLKLIWEAPLHKVAIENYDSQADREKTKADKHVEKLIEDEKRMNEMLLQMQDFHYGNNNLEKVLTESLHILQAQIYEKRLKLPSFSAYLTLIDIESSERRIIVFADEQTKLDWVKAYREARSKQDSERQELSWSVDRKETLSLPNFLNPLMLMESRSGMEATCACQVETTRSDITTMWVCRSDKFGGQVVEVISQNGAPPNVNASYTVSASPILCLTSVPETSVELNTINEELHKDRAMLALQEEISRYRPYIKASGMRSAYARYSRPSSGRHSAISTYSEGLLESATISKCSSTSNLSDLSSSTRDYHMSSLDQLNSSFSNTQWNDSPFYIESSRRAGDLISMVSGSVTSLASSSDYGQSLQSLADDCSASNHWVNSSIHATSKDDLTHLTSEFTNTGRAVSEDSLVLPKNLMKQITQLDDTHSRDKVIISKYERFGIKQSSLEVPHLDNHKQEPLGPIKTVQKLIQQFSPEKRHSTKVEDTENENFEDYRILPEDNSSETQSKPPLQSAEESSRNLTGISPDITQNKRNSKELNRLWLDSSFNKSNPQIQITVNDPQNQTVILQKLSEGHSIDLLSTQLDPPDNKTDKETEKNEKVEKKTSFNKILIPKIFSHITRNSNPKPRDIPPFTTPASLNPETTVSHSSLVRSDSGSQSDHNRPASRNKFKMDGPTVWVGTESGGLMVFQSDANIRTQSKHTIRLTHPACSICYHRSKVFVGLGNGHMIIFSYSKVSQEWAQSEKRQVSHIDHRILCITSVQQETLWLAEANRVHVFAGDVFKFPVKKFSLWPKQRNSSLIVINQMVYDGNEGVWVCLDREPTLHLYSILTFSQILQVDCMEPSLRLIKDKILYKHMSDQFRISSVHATTEGTWVGTSSGILAFISTPKYDARECEVITPPSVCPSYHGHTAGIKFIIPWKHKFIESNSQEIIVTGGIGYEYRGNTKYPVEFERDIHNSGTVLIWST